jgi:hypothetical protein
MMGLTLKDTKDKTNFEEWVNSATPLAGGALESNINGIWFSLQPSGKGVPYAGTTGTKRARWSGGDINSVRADGMEPFSDGTIFSDNVDFVNTITGTGSPVIMGQSSLVAYLAWLGCGQEVVTGGVNAIQTLTASAALTAGSFTISTVILSTTYTTAAIAFNATAAAILSAISAAFPSAWVTANITATGGPINATGTPVVLTFGAALGFQPIPALTTVSTGLTGGTVTVTQTATGANYSHVAQPSNAGGFYFGCAKSVGKSVVYRAQFNDCRMVTLRIEGSSASKIVKLTPQIISLDPAQELAADPTTIDNTQRPFLYTEAAGTLTIDGQVYSGLSAFAVVLNWAITEYYGDNVTPYDFINNEATITIEGLTLLIDSLGLTRFNNQIYGTPSPAPGARPIKGVPTNGSYSATFTKINPQTGLASDTLNITIPGVKWDPSLTIPANPAGGAVELSFAGAMRKAPGNSANPIAITTTNWLDPAFTV